MAPRTGKTLVALRVVGRRNARLVLVACPKTAKFAWRRNIRKHVSYRYRIRSQMPPGGLRGLRKSLSVDPAATYFLILNFDAIRRLRRVLGAIAWDAIIADESHRLKNRASRQSKTMYYIARDSKAKYRMLMTGSEIEGNELDLWAQFRFAKPELLGADWKKFEKRWCRKTGYQLRKRKLKKHLRDKFLDKVAPYCYMLDSKEVMKFPTEDIKVKLTLSPKARRLYDGLEREFVTEYKGEQVVTPFVMTQMIRLQQITGGYLVTDENMHLVDRGKLNATVEIVQDTLPAQVVIFCRFLPEVELIYNALKKLAPGGILVGGMSDRERAQVLSGFQEKRQLKWLVAQIATGGASVDMYAAQIGIFYSKDFSRINYKQARARLDEFSQTSTTFFHLMQENTIDAYLDNGLTRKGKLAEYVFNRLKKGN